MAVITRSEAIQVITRQVAADKPPTLSGPQIEELVDAAARPDADGNSVDDDDWTSTYDLNAATAAGWELKAADAANRFDINIDRQGLTRSQLFDHCTKMADRYRRRVVGAARRKPPENFHAFR